MSSALSGITSSLASSQSDATSSISIPSDLTPAQEAEVQSILGQLASGSITSAQAQSEISALASGTQNNQSTQSTQGPHPHHGHHGKHADGAGAQGQTLASALDLTADQQSQIGSLVQSAQQNNTPPSTLLSQIESVLTPDQQQKLAQLLSPTYSSAGTSTGSQPPLFSTTA